MVRKIREGGDGHPAAALYDELDQVNDYTAQYHHGENIADATPDQLYRRGENAKMFERTASRLDEMQSEAWLEHEHAASQATD